MLRRWVSTVFSLRNSSPAIWRFVWRSQTSSAISRSRSVSCSSPAPAADGGARAARHAMAEPPQLLRRLLAQPARAGGVERRLGGRELARCARGVAERRERPPREQLRVRRVAHRADRRGGGHAGLRALERARCVALAEAHGGGRPRRLRSRHAEAERVRERRRARRPLGGLVARAVAQRRERQLLPHRRALGRHDARRRLPADRLDQQRAPPLVLAAVDQREAERPARLGG